MADIGDSIKNSRIIKYFYSIGKTVWQNIKKIIKKVVMCFCDILKSIWSIFTNKIFVETPELVLILINKIKHFLLLQGPLMYRLIWWVTLYRKCISTEKVSKNVITLLQVVLAYCQSELNFKVECIALK